MPRTLHSSMPRLPLFVLSAALAGCDPEGGDPADAREGDLEISDADLDADELDAIDDDAIDDLEGEVGARRELPPEAAASMKAATDASLAPQFHACPYYVTYETSNFDEFGNEVAGWLGVSLDAFVIDEPTWFPFGSSLIILCGTTQSPHQWMSVRRVLSGVTSCVTSATGSPNAWFVCS
jgi:hypothetical protein